LGPLQRQALGPGTIATARWVVARGARTPIGHARHAPVLRHGPAHARIHPNFTEDPGRHATRVIAGDGPAVLGVRTTRSGSRRTVRDRPRSFRDVPHTGCQRARRRRVAALRGARIPQVLSCGWLAGKFARLRCGDSGLERLLAFSCNGRLCPSRAGRRVAERAAHLVDQLFDRNCSGHSVSRNLRMK
jgi:hypothetical protein